METLNLGILAHVDAGKTSLTERLLYSAGIIEKIGSVDQGNTQTDSLALEQQRGITIKSAVVSFEINNVTINLIDTPGHPDFIAEVERVLGVLDGAVLVISAVEGVQAQTRVLMRTLQRLHIPTLIFVNKIDRSGAQYETLLKDIAEKLKVDILPMGLTRTLEADFTPYEWDDHDFKTKLTDFLSGHNDQLLATYVGEGSNLSYHQLLDELAVQTKQALVHPVFFGSAITGAGVDSLITGITKFLPVSIGNADGPISGTVFKIERNPSREKVAYVHIFSGTVHTRDRLSFAQNKEGKVTSISVFDRGSSTRRTSITAGEIGELWGLDEIQIGDAIGKLQAGEKQHYFAPPTLETVVVPKQAESKGALYSALSQLAEQDPLINLRQDDIRSELFVSLYGEVQKEVIQSTLINDYGLNVEFRETTPICVERPAGRGEAVEILQEETNPTSATIGLTVEPGPIGSGIQFQLGDNPGRIPLHIYKTTDKFVESMTQYISRALQEGLFGWRVTDCLVTMTKSGYYASDGPTKPVSDTTRTVASDFRILTPLVLMAALKQAGTVVCEPIHHFRLEIPEDTYGAVLPVLAQVGATPLTTTTSGSSHILEGDIPAVRMNDLQRQLPALTSGEGVLECNFDRYEQVKSQPPVRSRTNTNPLNRKEYLGTLRGVHNV